VQGDIRQCRSSACDNSVPVFDLPFDPVADYDGCIDGKLRADGPRFFQASRGSNLPGVDQA
jgi:hypothetical protein